MRWAIEPIGANLVHMRSPATASVPRLIPEGLWVVEPERSAVRFRVRHMLVASVEGHFGAVSGTVSAAGRALHAEGSVEVGTIDTGMSERDKRLCGPGFFDAGVHPQIRFRAMSATPADDGSWSVDGELTISDSTVPITFIASASGSAPHPRIRAEGSLSRSAHGLDWPGLLHSGRAVVGDRVEIELDLELR